MKVEKKRSDCPVTFAVDIFGDRWSLLILRDLLLKGKKTYGELLGSQEKIATNILADRLKKLEEKGIIEGVTDPEKKSKIIYSPTQKGLDLLPVLVEVIGWSAKYDNNCHISNDIRRMMTDKADYIAEVKSRFTDKYIG